MAEEYVMDVIVKNTFLEVADKCDKDDSWERASCPGRLEHTESLSDEEVEDVMKACGARNAQSPVCLRKVLTYLLVSLGTLMTLGGFCAAWGVFQTTPLLIVASQPTQAANAHFPPLYYGSADDLYQTQNTSNSSSAVGSFDPTWQEVLHGVDDPGARPPADDGFHFLPTSAVVSLTSPWEHVRKSLGRLSSSLALQEVLLNCIYKTFQETLIAALVIATLFLHMSMIAVPKSTGVPRELRAIFILLQLALHWSSGLYQILQNAGRLRPYYQPPDTEQALNIKAMVQLMKIQVLLLP